MIDLHTHILPGVDDGVTTEDEAVEFARMAVDDGIRVCVATPHCKEGFYINDRSSILSAVQRLTRRLEQERIELVVEPGAEVHICPDLVERVRDGRAPTLADNGTTLLLELSLTQYPVDLENLIFQLKLAGLEVLLAHPERIRFFQDDVTRLEAVIRLGAYGQITTGSILGVFGRTARSFSEELPRKELVHVVASDAHGTGGRPPVISQSIEAMIPIVGEARARSMAKQAPAALLEGRAPELPPIPARPSRRRFGWLPWRSRA